MQVLFLPRAQLQTPDLRLLGAPPPPRAPQTETGEHRPRQAGSPWPHLMPQHKLRASQGPPLLSADFCSWAAGLAFGQAGMCAHCTPPCPAVGRTPGPRGSPHPPWASAFVSPLPSASSAAVGSGPPPEAEQAWPQSSGEEELQLQLALAMSKEEADQVGAGGPGRGAAIVLPSIPPCSPRPCSSPSCLVCSPSDPVSSSVLTVQSPPSPPGCVACPALRAPAPHRRPVSVLLPLFFTSLGALPLGLRLSDPRFLCPSVFVGVHVSVSLSWSLFLAPHSQPASLAPTRPLTLSLSQPPSCGPEDDVQLQLALSLSREEHDKVRAASPPPSLPQTLPGSPHLLTFLKGPHSPTVTPQHFWHF